MDKMSRKLLSISLVVVSVALPASRAMAEDPVERVEVGQEAPPFELETLDGSRLSLETLRGEAPLVLIFFRGTW